MVDRGKAIEALDQIVGLDDRGHHFLLNNSPGSACPSRQRIPGDRFRSNREQLAAARKARPIIRQIERLGAITHSGVSLLY
jgi:hypothetical protein